MDKSLRNLERAASSSGDPYIIEQLELARQRAGLCKDCGGPKPLDHTSCLKCQPSSIIWDTSAFIRDQAAYLVEENPELSLEDAMNDAAQYDMDHESEWTEATLGEWIEELNPYGYDWLNTTDDEEVTWDLSRATRQTTNQESYRREVGYQFMRTFELIEVDPFTIWYTGDSLMIQRHRSDEPGGDVIVPGEPCEHCEKLHPSEEAAENCCISCRYCEEPYPTKEAAENCCFACSYCQTITDYGYATPTIYDTREEAESCCNGCSICGSTWDTPEEAKVCCSDSKSRYRYNPDDKLTNKLAMLEEDYFDQPPYLRRKDLIKINNIRRELGLPQVNTHLKVPETAEEIEQRTRPKSKPVTDKHTEAREIYRAYLDKIEKMEPHIAYANRTIKAVTGGGGSMTPVMPLATMGTSGGPILCDYCREPIPLEGGNYHKVPANIAWANSPQDPSWRSYIAGGLVTFQHSNRTARFYHGYERDLSCCFNQALKKDDAAEAAFNANRPETGQKSSLLRKFITDELPEVPAEDRGNLVMKIINTLYRYDPGIGVNRP